MASIRLRRRLTAASPPCSPCAGAATLSGSPKIIPAVRSRSWSAMPPGAVPTRSPGCIAPPLSKALGQPVVVQNLPGGGGQVAATTVLRDGADGLALLATNQPDLSISTVFNKPPYKSVTSRSSMVDSRIRGSCSVQKESAISTFADFVAKRQGRSRASSRSPSPKAARRSCSRNGCLSSSACNVRIVGYNGGSGAANAMLAGDVVATVGDDFARFNMRDKSKALFVAAAAKSPRWPEAPTLPMRCRLRSDAPRRSSSHATASTWSRPLSRRSIRTLTASCSRRYPGA